MINLHRLNGQRFLINAELIETIESHGNTVIVLSTGNKYVVRETSEEVTEAVIEYQQKVRRSGRAAVKADLP